MKLEFSRQFSEKYSDIKFHKNPSSGSRVVARGRTDGQTDMAELIAAFRNFANAPHNHSHHNQCRTPYAAVHTLVLLMMGIMVPETC